MIDFIDRVSSGKKILKYENGTTQTVTIENAEDATVEGTPLNRENLMALQGFISNTITFSKLGSVGNYTVVETNDKGETLTTFKVGKNMYVQNFVGEKTISKEVTMDSNGITEVIK